MLLPVQTTDVVFHLGDLDPSLKGKSSYEAHGLSVSLCPEAWQGIAEISSNTIHALTRPGAAYLDLLALEGETRDVIRDWAIENELIESVERFRVWSWDCEAEVWSSCVFETEEEARIEAACLWDVDETSEALAEAFEDIDEEQSHKLPDGVSALVGRIEMDVLTPGGVTRAMAYGRDLDGFEIGALFWVEDVGRHIAPELVGVWWMEDFAPEQLSAPRGAILPVCLADFEREVLDWDAYYERTNYFPEPATITVDPEPAPAYVH